MGDPTGGISPWCVHVTSGVAPGGVRVRYAGV